MSFLTKLIARWYVLARFSVTPMLEFCCCTSVWFARNRGTRIVCILNIYQNWPDRPTVMNSASVPHAGVLPLMLIV